MTKMTEQEAIALLKAGTLPPDKKIEVGGSLVLWDLTTLPEGTSLSAGGSLDIWDLTTLPEGTSLSAGGSLDIGDLTTLPEGTSLSAGGSLDIWNLTTETQRYQGKTIRLRTVDGVLTRLISKRKLGDITLWRAQYFKGHLDSDPRCYVAEQGDFTAHGDTADQALRDLRFKIAQVDFDPAELAATIRQRGTVTFNDYRLITGACDSGLREGLRSRGIDPDTDELPLDQALELCRDGFGGGTFIKAMQRSAGGHV